jgi:phosphoglycolate phosphatase-like HAD superfamily hydrolase
MIRHVVFDFDGTLVASPRIKEEAFAEVAGAVPDGARVMEIVRNDGEAQDRHHVFTRFAAHLAPQVGRDDVEAWGAELAADYTRLCEERISACPACPGAMEALAALRDQGRRIYLNSATPDAALRRILDKRGMTTAFDDIRGIPPTKTENLRALLAAHAAAPAETAVIGDGRDDREAALATGCHFVYVACGGGDCTLGDLRRLPGHLDALKGAPADA